jgi:hypothetical protein
MVSFYLHSYFIIAWKKENKILTTLDPHEKSKHILEFKGNLLVIWEFIFLFLNQLFKYHFNYCNQSDILCYKRIYKYC